MIVTLFDKTQIIVTRHQGELVMQALEKGVELIRLKGALYKSAAIASVTPGGDVPVAPKRLPDRTTLSDYEIERRRKKVIELKQQFLKRHTL